MTQSYRPPCPSCGARRMWKIRNKPLVKCSNCGELRYVDDPALRLPNHSHLADLARKVAA